MGRESWTWMPHPGHFICSFWCRFHLNTHVGDPTTGYIVSTVGEYVPDDGVREIKAMCRGITLDGKGDARLADYMKKIGYEQIGCDRLYETMVFPSQPLEGEDPEQNCCPFRIGRGSELDFRGYNGPYEALQGHISLCEKWEKMPNHVPDESDC